MADEKKIVTQDIFEKAISDVLQVVAENTFDFVEYESDEVDALFDVESPEKLAYYESLINPDLVSENRLWSSKTIADKIAESIVESNSYADGLIKDISSIQLEWCETSLPAIGESNKIYILPTIVDSNTVNTLNIWNTKTSAYVSIGNLDISLDGYVKTQDMNTALDTKANDNEVLKLDNVLTTTGVETNDNVYSAKLTKTELDKKANDSEVVKKTDIDTTLNSTSTDDKVPSAKSVNNELYIGTEVTQSFIDIYGNDILKFPKGRYNIRMTAMSANLTNIPTGEPGVLEISSIHDTEGNPFDTAWCHRIYKFEPYNGGLYIKTLQSNNTPGNIYVDTGWQRVCTTKVADVPVTDIEFTDSNVSKTGNYEICKYYVKNGYAYVTLNALTFNSNYTSGSPFATLPKPIFRFSMLLSNAYNTVNLGRLFIEPNGEIHLYSNSISTTEFGCISFSYPVAED